MVCHAGSPELTDTYPLGFRAGFFAAGIERCPSIIRWKY